MKAITTVIKQQPHILNSFLLLTLVGLAFLYIYFLSSTVVHVVMRKEINRDMSNIRSEISSLEAEYMTAQHRISEEIATRTDLAQNNEKIFINRTTPSLVLGTRDDS